MPTSDPYKTPYEDPAAKKKREDPLADYFGGQPKAPPPAPVQQMQTQVAPVQMASPNMAQPLNTAQPAAQRRPGPTGFTNFNRVIAANKDVSNREAAAYGQRAQQNAQQARTSLDALRKRFGEGVAAGTVGGPPGASPSADGLLHIDPDTGLPIGPVGGPLDGRGSPEMDPMSGLPKTGLEGMTPEDMYARSRGTYTGPVGLSEIEGSGQAYADSLGAEQNLGALGSEGGLQALIQNQNLAGNQGTSKLSSALIGNAGRGDFNALRQRFNPASDMTKAESESMGQAKSASEASKRSAQGWKDLGDKTAASNKAIADSAAKAKADQEAKAKSEADEAAFEKKWQGAMAHNIGDTMNSNFETFNDIMSPITQIANQAGYRDPIQDYGTGLITPQGGAASGGGSRKIWWQPQHRDVYRQMDDAQWAELRKLPQGAQARWMDERLKEIRSGKPHDPSNSAFNSSGNAFYGVKI